MAPGTDAERRLLAWIWYPTELAGSQAPCPYLPDPWRRALERTMGPVLTNLLTRDLTRVHSHSVCDGEVARARGTYPVLLMRAGLAAEIADYTGLAEDLASHGYFVVGFDAPYRSFVVVLPDGTVIKRAPENNADLLNGTAKEHLAERLVESWTADMGWALDELTRLNDAPVGRFAGRLDLGKVGVFGHSLGGATALRFCHQDLRCKALVDLDGAPIGDLRDQRVTQPLLFLLSDHSREPADETRPVEMRIRSLYLEAPAETRWELVIRGGQHFGFADPVKSPLFLAVIRTLGGLHMKPDRQLAVTGHCLAAFFDVYLRGAPRQRLAPAAGYPDVAYLY